MKRSSSIILGLAILFISCESGNGRSGAQSVYPLKVSYSGRYLTDQNNEPVLMIGDAPQALMVNASLNDVDIYLANRAAHGFNVIWVNLLCNESTGGRADASSFDGLKPFITPGDLSTPDEAYFARCDQIVRYAARHGLTVILDPIETIGFLGMMRANGVAKCAAYGRYLGNRYKSFDNIIWMSGNDFQTWNDASDDAVVKAVAVGIKETDTRHIHTIELNYLVSSSLDNPNWQDIVTLNAAYTRFPVYAEVLKDYNRTPAVPVFIIEAAYEEEHDTDPERLRRQEYWSFLAGACGHVYGNALVCTLQPNWKDHLNSVGVQEFGYCRTLFRSLAWFLLVPDQTHALRYSRLRDLSDGGTPFNSISENDYATAASTPDGKLALVYVPSARTITVALTKLSGPIKARWYDPTSGTYQAIDGSPFSNSGFHDFSTPGTHSDGASDWILVLDTQ